MESKLKDVLLELTNASESNAIEECWKQLSEIKNII